MAKHEVVMELTDQGMLLVTGLKDLGPVLVTGGNIAWMETAPEEVKAKRKPAKRKPASVPPEADPGPPITTVLEAAAEPSRLGD